MIPKRTQPYGENPQGVLIFDEDSNYSLQILRADRAKFVSGFGKFSISASENTITFQIQQAFFPNWEGIEQKRTFTLTDKEFKYIVPTTTNGAGISSEVVWTRRR